ncbi:nicalin-1-like [Pomacea canaliculata]|uniref:nicalin-1-like n=1 Tax=Pomacea canaliculata TaxID=400727 RepID=UPI000D72F606|nr:nicalin-1-like [Pomacea canaliculata]
MRGPSRARTDEKRISSERISALDFGIIYRPKMWFTEAGEIVEMFRSSFPLSFLFFVPIFILISPVSPVYAAQEFNVYRMQQFDLQGSSYGCKSSLVNVEARPIDSKMLTRRCVVARLRDVTVPKFRDLMAQNAGALLVLLPKTFLDLTAEEEEHLQSLERDLMQEDVNLPVYFAHETEELQRLYEELVHGSAGDQASTAWEALLSSATANGFQIVVNGAQSKALPDFSVTNLQGRLSGHGIEEQLPTIVISAYYDATGIAPGLAYGADSNGSGVVALLELARLFSKLYTNSRTHAKYNLVFLLSGGGKFNYQGTKRWIEDNIESTDSNLLADVAFVLCLDSLGSGDSLHLHVSKPPKEDSEGGLFLKNVEQAAAARDPPVEFSMVHKKINLADELLAWEHERFSIKRLLAFTASHLDSPKSLNRSTILDTRDRVNQKTLSRNIYVVADALARHMYNLTNLGNFSLFTEALGLQEEGQISWLDFLTEQPRAAPLLPPESSILNMLEDSLNRFLKDVRRSTFRADKRDPEFVFYTGAVYSMNAFNVKPAVFDLFLAVVIAVYLTVIYLLATNFHLIYGVFRKMMTSAQKVKSS